MTENKMLDFKNNDDEIIKQNIKKSFKNKIKNSRNKQLSQKYKLENRVCFQKP